LTAGPARAKWTGAAWRVEIALSGPRTAEARDFFVYPVDGFVVDNADVACREGKVVIPLIPSRGPGAPPPSAVGGILIVAGTGYELSSPVTSRLRDSAPAGSCPAGSSRSGLILFTSWR
jgi:hypothetical protein